MAQPDRRIAGSVKILEFMREVTQTGLFAYFGGPGT
jgi:hypothetical protein